MTVFTLPLNSPDSVLETAGGKGANLGRLIRGGFAVPPGFIVTTDAYRAFVRANRLEARILERVRSTRADDPDSFEDASRDIRLLFDRCPIPAMIRSAILKLLIRVAGRAHRTTALDLLGDLAHKTAVIDGALKQLAAQAAAVPRVRAILLERAMGEALPELRRTVEGQAFLEHVDAFLREHGARTMKMYLPFSNESWAEDPPALLATLAAILRSDATTDSAARLAAAAERFHTLREGVGNRLPDPLRRLFLNTLEEFRTGHVAREATLYAIEEAFALARRGVREASRRLVARAALPRDEDALFLTPAELHGALRGERPGDEVRRLVIRRRRARPGALAAWRDRGEGPGAKVEGALRGQPGSPGLATGPVKVIGGPEEFGKLQPGDVLVCAFADPAWTPLFSLASAVVSDTGGPLSHAAIVAREYGIPAVLGTQTATARLRDGAAVTVDGTAGRVKIH